MWRVFCICFHLHLLFLWCVVELEEATSLVIPCFFLSSDADRHAELSGSPLKSKSTRKPLSCIIGYLGGYLLTQGDLERHLYVL